jgi:hypothetical protein
MSTVVSHMSIQYVNQSGSLSSDLLADKCMVSPKKVHVQTTLNSRLQKITQAIIKLMSQKW